MREIKPHSQAYWDAADLLEEIYGSGDLCAELGECLTRYLANEMDGIAFAMATETLKYTASERLRDRRERDPDPGLCVDDQGRDVS